MQIVNRFHEQQLDSTEVALFLHLMVVIQGSTYLKIILIEAILAKDLFPYNDALKTHLNELLRQIKKHQSENYKQVEIRFGNLLLLLYEIDVSYFNKLIY